MPPRFPCSLTSWEHTQSSATLQFLGARPSIPPLSLRLHRGVLCQRRQNQTSYIDRTQQLRPLEGKLALVTGASRGIGAAIARNLGSKGCSLLLNYASASSDKLTTVLASDLKDAHEVTAIQARGDISTETGCAAIIATAKEHFTNPKTNNLQIDILIHNAGIAGLAPLGAITPEDFYQIYATNVLGPILLTQACLPHLPHDRSGRIVNVSSIGSLMGLPEQTVYGGSKGALEAMTRVWSRELAERATVNSINPGTVMSDMYLKTPREMIQQLASYYPITPLAAARAEDSEVMKTEAERYGGRPAYDWEVAGVVAMLCSKDSGWTTGSVISANGGTRFSY